MALLLTVHGLKQSYFTSLCLSFLKAELVGEHRIQSVTEDYLRLYSVERT